MILFRRVAFVGLTLTLVVEFGRWLRFGLESWEELGGAGKEKL